MYANAQDSGRPSAHRRRRTRRRRSYRLLYAVNALLLIFAAVRVFSEIRVKDGAESSFITEAGAVVESTAIAEAQLQDTIPPVISGVKDILLYAGDGVDFFNGITATDDRDAAPTLNVDSANVDLTQPGEYTVTYFATDSAGNQTSAKASVTVLEKHEGFVDLATIYETVDAVLDGILEDGMTDLQKVVAIYDWARGTRVYGGHTTRSDYLQAAYEMLTAGRGDCYGYFAVTKLMFQRLEIPNIDVRKVKNDSSDSEHFWSLVSVDGGSTYYHFDSTPRLGGSCDFCLVTDAFLDAYSAEHNGSHNRDTALYPATPEE